MIYLRVFFDGRYIASYAFRTRNRAESHIRQMKRDFARLPFTYDIVAERPEEPIVFD